jgi:hypothetical protein
MLLLVFTGSALVELRAAQRLQAALALESAQAFWIAEGGLSHAAWLRSAIPSPVAFAGGSFTVTRRGAEYTAAGVRGAAARVLTRSFTSSGPLDEAASGASAVTRNKRSLELRLFSTSASDAQITAFALAADAATPAVERLRLEGSDLWRTPSGAALPTGLLPLNSGSASQRTVAAGDDPRLRIEFASNLSGTRSFTLQLAFTDGSSSTIVFTLTW